MPMKHFTLQTCMHLNGAKVGYYQGNIKVLMDDIAALKPTVFPTVPRLLNRLYDKVYIDSVPGSISVKPVLHFSIMDLLSFNRSWLL